jgi:hypothetical protein
MSTYSFEVASINERTVTTKFGPKKAYDLVSTDGTRYGFAFTNPARSGISVGTKVSASGEVGRFGVALDPKTVTIGGEVNDMETPAASVPKQVSYSGRAEKVFPLPTTHGDTAIIRQNALTNAVATVADFVATQPTEKWPTLDTWTDMVIKTAYKYAEFSSGQREMKAIKAMRAVGMEASEIKSAVEQHLDEGVEHITLGDGHSDCEAA